MTILKPFLQFKFIDQVFSS